MRYRDHPKLTVGFTKTSGDVFFSSVVACSSPGDVNDLFGTRTVMRMDYENIFLIHDLMRR